jgi:DNA-binding transcriptional ArsR family regulator
MTDRSAVAGAVSDVRRPPFCYQTHAALDLIRAHVPGARRAAVLGVYLTLTERANREGGAGARDGFTAARKELADAAGVSPATLDRHVATLEKAGVIAVERRREGKSHLPNRWVLIDPQPASLAPPSTDFEERGVAPKSVHKDLEEERRPKERGLELPAPPKRVLVEGRDLGFDALADACNVDPRNRRRTAELAGALKEIRGYVWDERQDLERGEPFEAHLAAEIGRRSALYRERLPGATLTPSALAKWWHDVDGSGPRRGVTGADFQHLDDL